MANSNIVHKACHNPINYSAILVVSKSTKYKSECFHCCGFCLSKSGNSVPERGSMAESGSVPEKFVSATGSNLQPPISTLTNYFTRLYKRGLS